MSSLSLKRGSLFALPPTEIIQLPSSFGSDIKKTTDILIMTAIARNK